MTTQHPEINKDLLSKLCCYLAPKKHWIKTKFHIDAFEIFANSCASSCAPPDEIYFITGTCIIFTGVTIKSIAEGLKVAGCGSVSSIIQDDNKDHI